MDGLLEEMHREVLLAADVRRLHLPITPTMMMTPDSPTQLIFEWELSSQQAVGIQPGQPAAAILPVTDPVLGNKSILTAAQVFLRAGQPAIRLNIEFPNQEMNEQARKRLVANPIEVQILVLTRLKP